MLEHPALSEVDYLKKKKTGPMLEHPALSEVDYYMRLDVDSFFLAPLPQVDVCLCLVHLITTSVSV
jgi:hypothetical protein